MFRLEAYLEGLLAGKKDDYLKEYCLTKLKEANFDLTKPIEYIDEIHTITFTQEES